MPWIRRGAFHYDVRARCTPAAAAALLADVPRLVSVHPLAVSSRELTPGPGVVRSTAITDHLRAGPFRFSITYRADVLEASENQVVTEAHQKPATVLRNTSTVSVLPDGVLIEVDIAYASPRPLFRYGFRKAQQAHHELAAGMKRLLEG